jgi:hypothetical protein
MMEIYAGDVSPCSTFALYTFDKIKSSKGNRLTLMGNSTIEHQVNFKECRKQFYMNSRIHLNQAENLIQK